MSIDQIYNKVLDLELFTESLKVAEYLCPLCTGVYYKPVVDGCGHVFCRECILKWFTISGSIKICPIFKTPYDSNIEEKVIRPLLLVQEILEKLEVKCQNKCKWKGKLRDMYTHIEYDCVNTNVNCSNYREGCPMRFVRNEKSYHENLCEYRPQSCIYCESLIPSNAMISHIGLCPKFIIECPQNCESKIERCQVDFHVKFSCEKTLVDCIFTKLGCKTRENRKIIKDHHISNLFEHDSLIVNFVINLSEKVEKLFNTIENFNSTRGNIKSNCKVKAIASKKKSTVNKYDEIIQSYNTYDNKNFKDFCKKNQVKKNTNIFKQKSFEDDPKFINNKRNRTEQNKSSQEGVLVNDYYDYNYRNYDLLMSRNSDYTQLPILNNIEENYINLFDEYSNKIFSPLNLDNTYVSNGLNVSSNKVTNISQVKNEHKFAFANLILNNSGLEKEYVWKIIIKRKSNWFAFGCCQKEKVISNSYKFIAHMKEHGCYLLSSNGFSWNTSLKIENNFKFEIDSFPNIENGDEIIMKYLPLRNELLFYFKKFIHVLHNVSSPKGNFLVPCIIFINFLDDVSFYFLSETLT